MATRLRVRRQDGATAVEYAIMVALIAAVIIAAVFSLGGKTNDSFACIASEFETPEADCP